MQAKQPPQDRILDAAMRVFRRHGFRRSSIEQAAEHAVELASRALVCVQRFGFRHRREADARSRKQLTVRSRPDDEYPALEGIAWA